MQQLKEKQQLIYDFIKREIRENGYPPSIREIGKACGLSSTSSVHAQLSNLERLGYIQRIGSKTRSIRILEDDFYTGNETEIPCDEYINVPIIGRVSAGLPIMAEENFEGTFPIPVSVLRNNDAFMLKIEGDSMKNAGIFDGDMVLVNSQKFANNNDIVIALLEDEITCKRFFVEDDHVRLQPENDDFEPIILNDVSIVGKVIGLFRSFIN